MSDLTLNKYLGAGLGAVLGVFALGEVSNAVFGHGGGHHGEEEPASINAWAEQNFAYYVEIPDAGGGEEVEEEVFDLGLALANADVSRGEQSMQGKCVACHNWNEGGANGTGPNLYNVVGRDIGAVSDFRYSSTMGSYPGNWTYEELNGFLLNPSQYMPGTAMSYAGIRRDGERAAVIAFLAAQTESPPPFPAPLDQAADADEAGAAPAEDALAEDAVVQPASAPLEDLAGEAREGLDAAQDRLSATVEDAAEAATDQADETAEAVGELVPPSDD